MQTIILDNFVLEKLDLTNNQHLNLISAFDRDETVKKYLYPYKKSFYDLVSKGVSGSDIFHNFYVIRKDNKIVGYIQIEAPGETYLRAALLKEERQKGIISELLKELSKYLLTNYKEVNSINAIIRNTNLASINAVKKAGFINSDSDNEFETYTKTR